MNQHAGANLWRLAREETKTKIVTRFPVNRVLIPSELGSAPHWQARLRAQRAARSEDPWARPSEL
jgi:hypothetical protein